MPNKIKASERKRACFLFKKAFISSDSVSLAPCSFSKAARGQRAGTAR